jgi:hypothetical protein
MAWPSAANFDEEQRRVQATLAKATATLMSNAKWQKVFAVLRDLNVGAVRWKFVRDDRIFDSAIPRACAMRDEGFGDVLPSPYADFREIDWIEVPQEWAAKVVDALALIGKFPLRDGEHGIRIVGYDWQRSA